jgi:hypothetical protein
MYLLFQHDENKNYYSIFDTTTSLYSGWSIDTKCLPDYIGPKFSTITLPELQTRFLLITSAPTIPELFDQVPELLL